MVPRNTDVAGVVVAGRVNHNDEPERVASAVVPSVSHESTTDTTDPTGPVGPFGSDAVVCPFTDTRPIPTSTLTPLASNLTRLDGLDGLSGLDGLGEASISTTMEVAWIVVQLTFHDPEPEYTTGTEATKPLCGVYSNIVLFSGNPGPVYIFFFFFFFSCAFLFFSPCCFLSALLFSSFFFLLFSFFFFLSSFFFRASSFVFSFFFFFFFLSLFFWFLVLLFFALLGETLGKKEK
jgi:hypothetical protein